MSDWGVRRAQRRPTSRARPTTCRLALVFDPASFVLTAFGRSNSGTICGDVATAERFLNLFFRI